MTRYSFVGSDGTRDPGYEHLEIEDPVAVSKMSSKFGREVLGSDPNYAPGSDFFAVKVIENGVLQFTVFTFRPGVLLSRRRPPAAASAPSTVSPVPADYASTDS